MYVREKYFIHAKEHMMPTLTIRVDEETKREASEVARYYGFDLSSVTRAFWKEMARTHSIPLTLRSEEPNEESLQSICEADEIIAKGGRGMGLKTARDMFDALGI